jgi:inhibitor of KinA
VNEKKHVYPRVIPAGETAFTVEFGDRVNATLNYRVHKLDAYLLEHPVQGIIELVPTYRSLLVMYDPGRIKPFVLQQQLHAISKRVIKREPDEANNFPGQLVEIPVRYGGEWGPDLADVAEHCHLSIEAVMHKHIAPTYQVAMLGFAPGFAYLLGLPDALATPRLSTPRVHIAPGSVGIAGSQTGIYALDTPGGWRIIGRTTAILFDPYRNPPFLLNAGDRVKFSVQE